MEITNTTIDAMIELLEVVSDRKVNLSEELKNCPDFSNYLNEKSIVEMGGHIPQEKVVSDVEYCVKPDIAIKLICGSDNG